MGRKGVKVPNEAKIEYARLCFENRISQCEAARRLELMDLCSRMGVQIPRAWRTCLSGYW